MKNQVTCIEQSQRLLELGVLGGVKHKAQCKNGSNG